MQSACQSGRSRFPGVDLHEGSGPNLSHSPRWLPAPCQVPGRSLSACRGLPATPRVAAMRLLERSPVTLWRSPSLIAAAVGTAWRPTFRWQARRAFTAHDTRPPWCKPEFAGTQQPARVGSDVRFDVSGHQRGPRLAGRSLRGPGLPPRAGEDDVRRDAGFACTSTRAPVLRWKTVPRARTVATSLGAAQTPGHRPTGGLDRFPPPHPELTDQVEVYEHHPPLFPPPGRRATRRLQNQIPPRARPRAPLA